MSVTTITRPHLPALSGLKPSGDNRQVPETLPHKTSKTLFLEHSSEGWRGERTGKQKLQRIDQGWATVNFF